MSNDYVLITDVGSVDPDDVFTLLLLSSYKTINIKGVIASHFYSDVRAKIIKLILTEIGRENIPVYVGKGIKYSEEYNEKSKNEFFNENELFPELFGFPKSTHKISDLTSNEIKKDRFPNFLKAYYEYYGEEYINGLKIEKETSKDFLINLLKDYSIENKLKVICVAPMHDLVDIPTKLYKNMDLYVMGGGFEENIDEFLNNESEYEDFYMFKLEKVAKIKITKIGYKLGHLSKCNSPSFRKIE